MSEESGTKGRQGLEILYARREAEDQLGDLAKRDIPCELRERYWIRNAEGAGIKGGIGISIGVPWWIERHELEQK